MQYLPEIVVSVARHASTSSSISLYAELSQADDVEQGGGNPGDTTYPYMSVSPIGLAFQCWDSH